MDEHFLITGGTGFLGMHLLSRILLAYPRSSATLLVRAPSQEAASGRLEALLRSMTALYGTPVAPGRVRALAGDVRLDDLGLRGDALQELSGTVTHIIHGAAAIRFDHPLEEARVVNCEGTRRILAIASRCGSRLERFVHIGTSSVSGRREGLILEEELECGQQFFNTYEQTKCEAERLVRGSAGRLPVVIVRPSIVIGDSRTGATTLFNAIYVPLRLMHRGLLRFMPGSPDTLLDLVPVDWVSDATLAIMAGGENLGKAFHLTAGPARAAKLGAVVEEALEHFEAHAPLASPRTLEIVSPGEFLRRCEGLAGVERKMVGQLQALFPYLTLDRLFSTANTERVLGAAGIRFPQFQEYAGRILAFALRAEWGKNLPGA
jgi:thioester reductase-like protein